MVAAGSAQHELTAFGGAFHQCLMDLSHPANVLTANVGTYSLDEPAEPGRSDFVGNMALEANGRGAFADRILEGVGIIEVGSGNEAQSLLEISICLPRKTDDDVGGEGDAWNCGSKLLDHLEIALAGVAAQH